MMLLKSSSSCLNSITSRYDKNNKTINLNIKRDLQTKKELISSFLKIKEKNKEKENNNVIKVNIKMWNNNSPRLNCGIVNNSTYSKIRDKIGDSTISKFSINSSNKKSNKKNHNYKNIKNNTLFIQNKFLLTEKTNYFIKKLKKIIYRIIFELIKQKYYMKNNKLQKKTFLNKSSNKKNASFKTRINNKDKEKIKIIQNNKKKDNNPLFLYNMLGINILGTQPSQKSNIKQNGSSKQKRKKIKEFSQSNSQKKYINKKENYKKKIIQSNTNSIDKIKKNYKLKNEILTDKKQKKEIEKKINKINIINSNPNISELKESKDEKNKGVKYYNTENYNGINNTKHFNNIKSGKLFGNNFLEKNKYLKNKKDIKNIIYEEIQNTENGTNFNNISNNSNNLCSIKNTFNLWKSLVIKKKVLISFIYKSKLDKFIMKIKNIIIKNVFKVINIFLLYKYFLENRDKNFKWNIMKNLDEIQNQSGKNINKQIKEINKYDIINNININNYIYSDYNKFIKLKHKNSGFASKLIFSKNRKDNLIEDLNEKIKNLNLFENKNQNIKFNNSNKQKYNNFTNYIFFSQTDRSYNDIKSNLFLDNFINDDTMNLKSINNKTKNLNIKNISNFNINNEEHIKSQRISNNRINQINQLRMVLNLIEKHKIKNINLYESFQKWNLITKINSRKNNQEIFWSFSNINNKSNKKNTPAKYSNSTYNKKLKNVSYSSKKLVKVKQDSNKDSPSKEIKNYRSNTFGKIPYFNYCNSSNAINYIEINNNTNVNSFEINEKNYTNNISNKYIYHKKIINLSNVSAFNNCFFENKNFTNNISMDLANNTFYNNKTNSLNKPKFIEEKKIRLKKVNKIEEREVNFALFKKSNDKDNNIYLNKSNVNSIYQNSNKEILFNNINFTNDNKIYKNIINQIHTNYKKYKDNFEKFKNNKIKECYNKRTRSSDLKKIKNLIKMNIIKNPNSSFSNFKTKFNI